MSRRYLVTCLSHRDRSRFKSYKELEDGDTIAGWNDFGPRVGNDFILRYSRFYDLGNLFSVGRITDISFPEPGGVPRQPFKLNRGLKFRPEHRELIKPFHIVAQTEEALIIIGMARRWH